LIKRIGLTLAITAGFFVFLEVEANATPVRPDMQKLLADPQETATQFAPARAGWQGPEMSLTVPPTTRALLDQSGAAQRVRASLLAAMIPDFRLVLLIGFAIVLLRLLWRPARKAPVASMPATVSMPVPEESPPAQAA